MLSRLPKSILLAALAAGTTAGIARGETLFIDTFETDTSANWNVHIGAFNEGDIDYRIDWGFDYSTQTFNLFRTAADLEPALLPVPPAPGSDGTTKGVKLTVNKDDIGARIVVSLYPKNLNASGNFVMKLDMFMNHGSWGDAGGGTTENAWFGINHLGTGPNWGVFTGNGLSTAFVAPVPGATTSDGLYYTVDGDGGGAKDLWALAGNAGRRSSTVTSVASSTSTRTAPPTMAMSRATSPVRSPLRPSKLLACSASAGCRSRCGRSMTWSR